MDERVTREERNQLVATRAPDLGGIQGSKPLLLVHPPESNGVSAAGLLHQIDEASALASRSAASKGRRKPAASALVIEASMSAT